MHWELLEVELFYMLSQALLLKRSLDRIACQTDQPHGCDTAIKWLQAHTMTLLWWWLIWLSSAKSSHWSAWSTRSTCQEIWKGIEFVLALSWHCGSFTGRDRHSNSSSSCANGVEKACHDVHGPLCPAQPSCRPLLCKTPHVECKASKNRRKMAWSLPLMPW